MIRTINHDLAERIAPQCVEQASLGERVLGALLAVVIGVSGALALAHWAAS